jgi:protease-4
MKKKYFWLLPFFIFFITGCTPHIHFDFLGKERIGEVVLKKSKALEKILVIDIDNIIESTVNQGLLDREGDILSQVYLRLQKAAEDKLIKGIILRLNTRGGEVTAVDIIYKEILNFRKKTSLPVVALMVSMATSGGYYIACACDRILAHPSTITGSIGVISLFPNVQKLISELGVEVNIIKSGKMKDAGSFLKKMNPEEKSLFQVIINEMFQRFITVVYNNRKDFISREEIKKIADGRIFTAKQALKEKLIDKVGYIDDALKEVFSLASISDAQVIAYTYNPLKKTNIYAQSGLNNIVTGKTKSLEKLFPTMKYGFYYLWLPIR